MDRRDLRDAGVPHRAAGVRLLRHLFGNYGLVYGALATLIVLVLWAYLSASIFLLGGQLASLVEGLEYQGKTRDDIRQHHEERSPVRKVKEALAERP